MQYVVIVRAFDGTTNSKTEASLQAARDAAVIAMTDSRTAAVEIKPVG